MVYPEKNVLRGYGRATHPSTIPIINPSYPLLPTVWIAVAVSRGSVSRYPFIEAPDALNPRVITILMKNSPLPDHIIPDDCRPCLRKPQRPFQIHGALCRVDVKGIHLENSFASCTRRDEPLSVTTRNFIQTIRQFPFTSSY